MGTQVIQSSFARGEISPSLWGRVDLAMYPIALKTCRNFIVKATGGVVNRAGTRFVYEVKDSSKPVRLIPFSFNSDQNYIVEAGDKYQRIFSNGALVPATYPAWRSGKHYLVGDRISHLGTNDECLVEHTSSADFLTDFSLIYWNILPAAPVELATDYETAELPALKFTQSADVLTLVHPSHPPMDLKRYAPGDWRFEAMPLDTGPFQDVNVNKGISVSCSANMGTVTLEASADLFDASHVGQLFRLEQRDFGMAWAPGATIAIGDIRRAGGKYYKAMTAGTTGVDTPTGTLDRWNDGGVDWLYLHSGYGVARITAVADSTHATADVLSYMPTGATGVSYLAPLTVSAASANPDGSSLLTIAGHGLTVGSYGVCQVLFTGGSTVTNWVFLAHYATPILTVVDADHVSIAAPHTMLADVLAGGATMQVEPPNSANVSTSYKWSFGAFGDPAIGGPGYPSAVTYYQQRMIFANTAHQPNGIWTSRAGNRLDYSKSSPIVDDDPITKYLASTQVDAIKALHAMDNLVVITGGAVWVSGGGQDDTLTPGNTAFKLQGYDGASDLPVIGVGRRALYVQDKGQVICDLIYEFVNNGYSADDLTVMASHLLDGHSIVSWAYQKTPFRCVWLVRDDGELLGLTYMREQQVIAWHHHDTDGFFEDVCVVGEGNEDAVYLVVRRTINGATKRYIERLESRSWTDIKDAFVVDCGLSFDGSVLADPAQTITITGGTTWDQHDAGLTVTASASASGGIFAAAPATSDIGDQLVWSDPDGTTYRLTITATTADPYVATGTLNREIPVAYRGAAISGWAWARNTFSGLGHLEGKEVAILADGFPQPRANVVGGVVTLDRPAARVHIGLPIQADLETLDLSVPGVETLLPKSKAISGVTVLTLDTQTIAVGRDFDRLEREGVEVTNYDQPEALSTGKVQLNLDTDWSKSASVCLRVDEPVPVGILAIIPNVSVGGA